MKDRLAPSPRSPSPLAVVPPERSRPQRPLAPVPALLVLALGLSCARGGGDGGCRMLAEDEPPCGTVAAYHIRDDCDDPFPDGDSTTDDDTTPSDDDTAADDDSVLPDDDTTLPDDDTTPVDVCPDYNPQLPTIPLYGACADNLDNDGDGCCDGADYDCGPDDLSNSVKLDEADQLYSGTLPCYNGLDDDGDGLKDCLDPDCRDENGVPSSYADCRNLYGYDPTIECAAVP
ncbi:hypothetical protein L6R50_23795 [Myxococcota bacterium]|nr:hypothetical protein [Myxococcota bacterium]